MTWIAVRCCCEPGRVLGFVRLPQEAVRPRAVYRLPRREAWGPEALARITSSPIHDQDVIERAEVRFEVMGGPAYHQKELAIPSGDKPVEWWRDVVGFVEVRA